MRFRGGYHDYLIQRGGIEVFPRLIAGEHRPPPRSDLLQSGLAELDALLGGGLECGTSTLIVGAAGTGKSSLAAQFVAAATQDKRAALFLFDESGHSLLRRSTGLGIDLHRQVEAGRVALHQVDPAELEAGAGAVVLAEEAVAAAQGTGLIDWLARQPPWSDLPVLLLSRAGVDSAVVAQAFELLGNVTVLERPVRIAALVSVVRVAIRAHLQEREHHLRAQSLLAAIVASSEDAIFGQTLDGTILTWNAGAERLFGYTALEAIGQSIALLLPPERRDEEAFLLQKMRAGEHVEHFETVRLGKYARRLDVSLTVSPMRDAQGRLLGVSKIARDITGRKQAAEALRAAREQLQVVTDNMAVAVTQCSRDCRYLWVSPGCAAWLGRPTEDIIGKQIVEILGVEAFEFIRPFIARVLEGECVEFEQRIPYRDVGPRWVRARYVPTRDAAGQTNGWVAVIEDTTAHHELESALRDADRRKDEFLAVLAHELRNPLAPIRNALHILRLTARPDPAADQVSAMIERQVNHMVRLVDDLMEVSRITRGNIQLRKEPIEVAAVLHAAVETSRPLIALTGWGQEEDRRRSLLSGFDHHLIKPADMKALEKLLVSLAERPT